MAAWTPTVTVEAAFGFGPFDTPSWTDISSYVTSVRTTRGRSSEFEQFPAGTCTVVLKDETRRFDPLNTAGPYFGQLLPNVPIRVLAVGATGLFAESWTGANGTSGFGAQWTNQLGTTGATIGINSNRGRMTTGTLTYGYSSARINDTLPADLEASWTVTLNSTAEQYVKTFVRGQQAFSADVMPESYLLEIDVLNGLLAVYSLDSAGSQTFLDSAAKTWAATTYSVRVRCVGGTIQAKAWTGAEPATWDVTVTDDTYSGGNFGFVVQGGNDTTSDTVDFDDLEIVSVHPVFYGFVDRWEQGYTDATNVVFVTVTATDGTKILAQKRLPQSVYETVVVTDGPKGYWKLDETEGTLAADSSGNRYDAQWPEGATRGVASRFGGQGAELPAPLRAPTSALTTADVFECWLKIDDPGTFTLLTQRTGTLRYTLNFASSGQITVGGGGYWTLNSSTLEVSTAMLVDGGWHHLFVNDGTIYVDGVEVYTEPFITSGPVNQPGALLVFGAPGVVMSDVANYDAALTAARVAAHYVAGTTPWDGDTTGVRVGRVLDLIDWPAGLRAIDSGEVLVGPAILAGRTAWDYLQTLAATEQGRLFFAADGKLTFHQADRDLTATEAATSQFTFTDDGGTDLGVLVGSLRFTLDDRFVYNEAQVTREGGTTVTARDDTSVDTYGPRTWALSGLFRDERQARHVAEAKVARYKDPLSRADAWRVNPEKDPSTWGDVLALDIGNRVTLEITPAQTGTQVVEDNHIEQIEHEITPSAWTVGFRGSPVDPNVDSYFTWGGDDSTQGWGVGVWR